jgi:hypothetical protein
LPNGITTLTTSGIIQRSGQTVELFGLIEADHQACLSDMEACNHVETLRSSRSLQKVSTLLVPSPFYYLYAVFMVSNGLNLANTSDLQSYQQARSIFHCHH